MVYYETGDIRRFRSARHYSSYSRVVPGCADSGGKRRRGRHSKQGNPHLKSAFSQAAVHAIRCYPTVRRYYERQLSRHRGAARKLVCQNIIAHKIAVATYHVLDKGTEFSLRKIFGN